MKWEPKAHRKLPCPRCGTTSDRSSPHDLRMLFGYGFTETPEPDWSVPGWWAAVICHSCNCLVFRAPMPAHGVA
jgi:hypothetical protein